ncbi:T9SS type A sorting domain-containing protein [bacterium]|nr:T9SS type A sorting domain-containing protein [bacterium]
MNKLFTLFFVLLAGNSLLAQVAKEQVLMMHVNEESNGLSLNWEHTDGFTGSYLVYKRMLGDASWTQQTTIYAPETTYLDNNAQTGLGYEYLVVKSSGGQTVALGYLYAGIKKEEIASKGGLILVIDSFFMTSVADEIARLESDLNAEGWYVQKIYAGRSETVPVVKDRIVAASKEMKNPAEALLLLGHIPVPYSGGFSGGNIPPPDGHVEGSGDHTGAWPADVFYGDLDGTWTDNSVNYTTSKLERNNNRPGDGKYDQTKLPSPVELQVGRVDFYAMPAFGRTEEALMIDYLDRNHAFRTGQWKARNRALIDNNFTSLNIASTGYHNFSTMFATDSISDTSDYMTSQRRGSYLWSYGCGAGSFTTCAGLNNGTARTSDFAAKPMHNVFTMVAGSFFGDWDYQDNFLRAPLCNSSLTSCWGGIPKWYVHHMSLGLNIGFGTRLTANNTSDYFNGNFNYSHNSIHIALMGDPTLCMYYCEAPSDLSAQSNNGNVELSWTAAKNVDGYNIYRVDSLNNYTKVNETIITTTSYIDKSNWFSGEYVYAVRAVKLIETASGSYYCISGGSADGVGGTLNETGSSHVQIEHINAVEQVEKPRLNLYPNPAHDVLQVQVETRSAIKQIEVLDLSGKVLTMESNIAAAANMQIPVANLKSGLYYLRLTTENGSQVIERFAKM